MLKKIRLISLRTRAILFVSLALLPLGIIALWQSGLIVEDQRRSAERGLVALTEKAAVRERQIIERAIGGAAALATTAHALSNSPELCRDVLSRFVSSSTLYGYVSFQRADGSFACASHDDTDAPVMGASMQQVLDQRIIGVLRGGADDGMSDTTSLVVATPVFEDAEYSGHLQLHVPSGAFRPDADRLTGSRPELLLTFNVYGEILTSEKQPEATRAELPGDRDLRDLALPEQTSFEALTQEGEARRYVVLPLVPGMVYGLGAWPAEMALLDVDGAYWRTSLLAAAMWLASVITVYLVMHFLVIKGLARLHNQMSAFSSERETPSGNIAGRGEFFEMEQNFRQLAQTIVQDEAELENAVHEKNVLLKEVHHRVKNNLQLINSIINMVLRGKPSDETRRIVRRLQDRVMALASVHRLIYQAQSMDQVNAAPVVEEVVNQSIAIGLPKGAASNVEMSLEPLVLYPDQALPLTLLVSEAITNAIKYSGDRGARITVDLGLMPAPAEGKQATGHLVITNAVGTTADPAESTSLGSKLMQAFAMQLGGHMETEETEGSYRLSIQFPVEDFSPDEPDTVLTREEAAA